MCPKGSGVIVLKKEYALLLLRPLLRSRTGDIPCKRPPLGDPVNGGLVYAQVAGDGLRGPSFGVERDHR